MRLFQSRNRKNPFEASWLLVIKPLPVWFNLRFKFLLHVYLLYRRDELERIIIHPLSQNHFTLTRSDVTIHYLVLQMMLIVYYVCWEVLSPFIHLTQLLYPDVFYNIVTVSILLPTMKNGLWSGAMEPWSLNDFFWFTELSQKKAPAPISVSAYLKWSTY